MRGARATVICPRGDGLGGELVEEDVEDGKDDEDDEDVREDGVVVLCVDISLKHTHTTSKSQKTRENKFDPRKQKNTQTNSAQTLLSSSGLPPIQFLLSQALAA